MPFLLKPCCRYGCTLCATPQVILIKLNMVMSIYMFYVGGVWTSLIVLSGVVGTVGAVAGEVADFVAVVALVVVLAAALGALAGEVPELAAVEALVLSLLLLL